MGKRTVEFKFDIDEEVIIIPVNRPGTINGLSFVGNLEEYNVIWWDEGVRHNTWLTSKEIKKA